MVQVPDPFQYYRSYRSRVHHRQWKRELQCKTNITNDLKQIISSIETPQGWYQNTQLAPYVHRIMDELTSLKAHRVYYDNYYRAYLDSKADMLNALERQLRYDEYRQQKADSDVLRDIDTQRSYLTRRSIRRVRSIPNDYLIRRVDEDVWNHSNVYYQGMDGDSLVHFCYLVMDAIHVDTRTKRKLYGL